MENRKAQNPHASRQRDSYDENSCAKHTRNLRFERNAYDATFLYACSPQMNGERLTISSCNAPALCFFSSAAGRLESFEGSLSEKYGGSRRALWGRLGRNASLFCGRSGPLEKLGCACYGVYKRRYAVKYEDVVSRERGC